MTHNKRKVIAAALVAVACAVLAPAQRLDRLPPRIDDRNKIRFRGSRNARIEKLTSNGPVDGSMRVTGISFRFKPTAGQQSELDSLLEKQQDPWSPLYHAWLTPEEYGGRFGLSNSDYTKVRAWIESQGFQVDSTAHSRTWIAFSGTATQVRQTFLTDLHRFQANGKEHYANVDEAALPADLEPLIYTVRGLDDLRGVRELDSRPQANLVGGLHGVGPGDLAVIYNLTPVHDSGLTGAGQKIAVVGESSFQMSDFRQFRLEYALPVIEPQMVLVPGQRDPGVTGEESEALIDLEYAGAAAPDATLLYVYANHAHLAAEYAVDRNLAPVISYSFLICEGNVARVPGAAEQFRNTAQQANAQGITWIACSGDSGPSGCQTQLVDRAGSSLSISVAASLPEVTAVGGTMFDEKPGAEYWAPKVRTGYVSALSYIPERAWNETDVEGTLAATGGGPSILYPKPAWQSGPGVPEANARHVPDISFAAAMFHDPYLIIQHGDFFSAGGTSAGTPFFAGVAALLNQHVVKRGAQAKPGLGNINPRLYQLAQTAPSVFHDIAEGDNIIPCKAGTPGCTSGKYGYEAGPGYDVATGLGSIDIKNLVDNWIEPRKGPGSVPTALAVTATPAAIAANSSCVLTATVKAEAGKEAPTGSVTFRSGQTALGSATLLGSGGTATATFSVAGSQLAPGANTITASYGGSGSFNASTGSVTVTVSNQPSGSVVVPSVTPNPVYREDPGEDGYEWFYRIKLEETAGVATEVTSLSIGGDELSEHIAEWFGGSNLPAKGTLAVDLRSSDLDVPTDVSFVFGGVDASGQRWTKQIAVPFLGKRENSSGPSGAMSLTSVPAVVVKAGKGDPNCAPERPYYQKLVLTETSGQDIQLAKFVAGGNNYTSSIGAWFGSTRLPAKGTLTAGLCWRLDSVPTTINYQMDGTDKSGKAVQAKLSVDFKSLDQKSGGELPAGFRKAEPPKAAFAGRATH